MRIFRSVVAVLLFFAVLVLALVAALSLYATPERIAQRIETVLQDRFGLKAELSGALEVKRFPKLLVSLPSGRLINLAAGSVAGKFSSARIELMPWGLFAESPRIERVAIEGLELETIPSPATGKVFWNIDQLDVYGASFRTRLPKLGEGTLSAVDASFTNLSESGGSARIMGNLAFANAERPAGGTFDLSGTFTLSGAIALNEENGSAVVYSPSASLNGMSASRPFLLSLSAEQADQKENVWRVAAAQFEWSDSPETKTIIKMPDLVLSSSSLRTPRAEVSSRQALNGDMWDIAGLGELSLDWSANEFKLGSLDISASAASSGTAQSRLTGNLFWSPSTVQADVEGEIFGAPAKIHLNRSDATPTQGTVELGSIDAKTLLTAVALFRPALTQAESTQAALSIGRIVLTPNLSVENFSAKLTGQSRALSLSQGKADFLAGKLQLAGICPELQACRLHAAIRNADLTALQMSGMIPMSGRLNGTVELSQAESSLGKAAELQQASASLSITHGFIVGIDIDKAHRILVEEAPDALPPEITAKNARTPFNELHFELSEFGTPECKISGYAKSANESGALLWQAALAGTAASSNATISADVKLPARGNTPELSLPIRADVASGKLSWRIDWTAASALAAKAHENDEFTLERFGQKIERALKDFWNSLELPELPRMPWSSEDADGRPVSVKPVL